jgi:dipeptidyl aminopeptidase/acylaminoacyl peptidase
VPAEQVLDFCATVRAAGGHLEHHVYPDEGHGWRRPETVADALRRADAFLTREVLR